MSDASGTTEEAARGAFSEASDAVTAGSAAL